MSTKHFCICITTIILGMVLFITGTVLVVGEEKVENREKVEYNVYLENEEVLTLDKVIIDKCYVILEYPDGHVVWLAMSQVKSVVKRRKE